MYRSSIHPTVGGKSATGGAANGGNATKTSPNKQVSSNNGNNNHASPTIREIQSRTIGGSARQLLANKRQAMSMERLNGNSIHKATSSASMNNINNLGDNSHNNNKNEKLSSPMNGSSLSISGSSASSPSRGSSSGGSGSGGINGGLNRTASRVSRFRSAKAVFERLSSANNASLAGHLAKPDARMLHGAPPKGTVASRYAAAAAARGIIGQHNLNNGGNSHHTASVTASRSRMLNVQKGSSSSSSGVASSNSNSRSPTNSHHSPKQDSNHQPKPQPRVITTATRRTPILTTSQISSSRNQQATSSDQPSVKGGPLRTTPTKLSNVVTVSTTATTMTTTTTATSTTSSITPLINTASVNSASTHYSNPSTATNFASGKPPPKDLIDEIVSEIVRDANKEHDADCTIQDLSNCDISGIPETLDFDKCFQDVEMMTEEEARKLLSRKSELPASSNNKNNPNTDGNCINDPDLAKSVSNVHGNHHERTGGDLDVNCAVDQNNDSIDANEVVKNDDDDGDNDDQDHASQDLSSNVRQIVVLTQVDGFDGSTNHYERQPITTSHPSSKTSASNSGSRNKVRFSEEPVTVYDTHAASDYDRRNDDIDPVAASAEYEIEKSRERDGIAVYDDEDEDDSNGNKTGTDNNDADSTTMALSQTAVGAVIQKFNSDQAASIMRTFEDFQVGSHNAPAAALFHHRQSAKAADDDNAHHDHSQQHYSHDRHRDSSDNNDNWLHQRRESNANNDEDQASSNKEYIESLEREVSLKRILEQNLRDLQSQYYETVKQLDSFKGDAEAKISKLEANLTDIKSQYESARSELTDVREQSNQFEKHLNDIKESSQLLEKKYHRAKKIIKDMQSREESFTRREQLYQQKLDEIEYELSVLIDTIDKTIYEDGLKYFSLVTSDNSTGKNNNCSKQHQTRLDVLGLIKKMMENFNNSKQTESIQIKQRIVTMLEQQLANLLASSNGCTSVTAGPVVPIPPVVVPNPSTTKQLTTATANAATNNSQDASLNNNNNDDTSHNQNYTYVSHRLSQPNMPHPIGVGGQPTKIFHGLTATSMMPVVMPLNEPSPPQSVNSYPSTNSLNSLSNNNNTNYNNNNNTNQQAVHSGTISLASSKLHQDPVHTGDVDGASGQQQQHHATTLLVDEMFRATASDVQAPYQTNEWHDKPVSEWTTTQVSTWLLALGLDQYISKFEDRNVNGQSLINLDSTVLKGLGVLNSNDRNLLKKKIRELRTEMEKERKLQEKKLKENLKERSKNTASGSTANQTNRQSWKKSLLS